MSTRLSLVCSLVWLAACGEPRIIGSAAEPSVPDGGLSREDTDRKLAQYASELRGQWQGATGDGATFLVEFMPSPDLPRSGTASSTVQVDCNNEQSLRSLILCGPSGPSLPPELNTEYWLLKLEGAKATVAILPDPDDAMGPSFTCQYVPAQQTLECGVRIAGVLWDEMVLRPVPASR